VRQLLAGLLTLALPERIATYGSELNTVATPGRIQQLWPVDHVDRRAAMRQT
jgi:hypothetical protein